jgi:hypothetical protein
MARITVCRGLRGWRGSGFAADFADGADHGLPRIRGWRGSRFAADFADGADHGLPRISRMSADHGLPRIRGWPTDHGLPRISRMAADRVLPRIADGADHVCRGSRGFSDERNASIQLADFESRLSLPRRRICRRSRVTSRKHVHFSVAPAVKTQVHCRTAPRKNHGRYPELFLSRRQQNGPRLSGVRLPEDHVFRAD